MRLVIERYSGLKNSTNGSYIIDQICKENDELLANRVNNLGWQPQCKCSQAVSPS